MTSPSSLLAMARQMQEAIEPVLPDHDPMVMRAAVLVLADAYLQKAALEQVMNTIHRKPPR